MATNFPKPIPDGWFAVAYSDELAPGAVQSVRYFGEDLVLYRTEGGDAVLMGAYCPHLGAHRGKGGHVVGEALQCPFHGWRFDKRGACVSVPYAERVPALATRPSRTYPLLEQNRVIYAWRGASGSEPTWHPQHHVELDDPNWSPFATYRWTVRSQAQEMAENVVDRTHFKFVHGTATVPDSEVEFEGVRGVSINRAKMSTPRGEVDGGIDIIQEGLGLTFSRFLGICDVILLTMTTPVDEQTVATRLAFSVDTSKGYATDAGVGRAIVKDIVKQLDQDIPVWENKIYLVQPALAAGDGPIVPFRRWAEQFYPESAEGVGSAPLEVGAA